MELLWGESGSHSCCVRRTQRSLLEIRHAVCTQVDRWIDLGKISLPIHLSNLRWPLLKRPRFLPSMGSLFTCSQGQMFIPGPSMLWAMQWQLLYSVCCMPFRMNRELTFALVMKCAFQSTLLKCNLLSGPTGDIKTIFFIILWFGLTYFLQSQACQCHLDQEHKSFRKT